METRSKVLVMDRPRVDLELELEVARGTILPALRGKGLEVRLAGAATGPKRPVPWRVDGKVGALMMLDDDPLVRAVEEGIIPGYPITEEKAQVLRILAEEGFGPLPVAVWHELKPDDYRGLVERGELALEALLPVPGSMVDRLRMAARQNVPALRGAFRRGVPVAKKLATQGGKGTIQVGKVVAPIAGQLGWAALVTAGALTVAVLQGIAAAAVADPIIYAVWAEPGERREAVFIELVRYELPTRG